MYARSSPCSHDALRALLAATMHSPDLLPIVSLVRARVGCTEKQFHAFSQLTYSDTWWRHFGRPRHGIDTALDHRKKTGPCPPSSLCVFLANIWSRRGSQPRATVREVRNQAPLQPLGRLSHAWPRGVRFKQASRPHTRARCAACIFVS